MNVLVASAVLTLETSTQPTHAVSDAKYRTLLSDLIAASSRYRARQRDAAFDACSDLGSRLYASSTPPRAKLLITALGSKGLAKGYSLRALGKAGDPAEVTPIFLQEVASTKTPDSMDDRSGGFFALGRMSGDRYKVNLAKLMGQWVVIGMTVQAEALAALELGLRPQVRPRSVNFPNHGS